MAVDWSLHGIDATADGRTVHRLPDLPSLLPHLDRPARLICEATIESWDPARRADLLARFRAAGHELYVFRPIHTARMRTRLGIEKSNENDARVIFRIASEGRLHLYPAPEPDPEWRVEHRRIASSYVHLRLAGEKGALIDVAERLLGPYRSLPAAHQLTLGNGKHYSPSLIAAVAFATIHASSRPRFERLLGLHGSGYPTILRSEVHHHSAQHALRRRGVTWRGYRKSLRYAYATLKPFRAELEAAVSA